MLAPDTVRWRQIVDACQILKLVDGGLTLRDAQFMLQFPGCSDSDTQLFRLHLFYFEVVQRV